MDTVGDKYLDEVFLMQKQLYRYIGPAKEVEYQQVKTRDISLEKKRQAQEELMLAKRVRALMLAPPLLPMPLMEVPDTEVIYEILPPYVSKGELISVVSVPKFYESKQQIHYNFSKVFPSIPRLVKSNQLQVIYDKLQNIPGHDNNNNGYHNGLSLQFDSNFENGNLAKVEKVVNASDENNATEEYYLTLTPDPLPDVIKHSNNTTARHTQWFHFRVQNVKSNVNYKFKIINMTTPK